MINDNQLVDELKEAMRDQTSIKELFEYLPEIIFFIKDLQFRLLMVNEACVRLLKALNTPWIEYDEKILASSLKDYQSDNKMKNLSIRSGFQRKATAFLMEDTYLTVEQLNKFLMKEKVKKFVDKIQEAWNKLLYKLMFKKYK